MLPDRVSNPGPLTYESGVLPIALRGPAFQCAKLYFKSLSFLSLSNITQNYTVSDSQGIQR